MISLGVVARHGLQSGMASALDSFVHARRHGPPVCSHSAEQRVTNEHCRVHFSTRVTTVNPAHSRERRPDDSLSYLLAGMMLNGQGFTLLAGALRAEAGDSTRAALLNVITEICRSRQPHNLSAGEHSLVLMTRCCGVVHSHDPSWWVTMLVEVQLQQLAEPSSQLGVSITSAAFEKQLCELGL